MEEKVDKFILRKELIDKLKDLNMRIHCKGFSWQHEDFFTLQEALPLIVGGFGEKRLQSGVENDGLKDEPICIHCGRKYSKRIEECFNFAPPAV